MKDVSNSLQILEGRFGLSEVQTGKLGALAASSVDLEISGTAVASLYEAVDVHIADSLAGLEVEAVRDAESIVDIGSGVGFPGLVLATVLPNTQVTLLDSVRKKMEVAAGLAREIELDNVECVWARVEEFSALGSPARGEFDVVSARALAPLSVLIEYAAPLLKVYGSMVAWKGTPEEAELTDAAAAESQLGFDTGELTPTKPFKGSSRRHFYVARKQHPTDDRYPRRPGAALRKPISA